MKLTPNDLGINPREVVTTTFGKHPVTGAPVKRNLYLGCNEIAEIEDILGQSLTSVLTDPKQNTRIGLMITLLWVAMKTFDTDLTKEEVGRTLSHEMVNAKAIWNDVTEALRLGVPGVVGADKSKLGDKKDPLENVAEATPTTTSI